MTKIAADAARIHFLSLYAFGGGNTRDRVKNAWLRRGLQRWIRLGTFAPLSPLDGSGSVSLPKLFDSRLAIYQVFVLDA